MDLIMAPGVKKARISPSQFPSLLEHKPFPQDPSEKWSSIDAKIAILLSEGPLEPLPQNSERKRRFIDHDFRLPAFPKRQIRPTILHSTEPDFPRGLYQNPYQDMNPEELDQTLQTLLSTLNHQVDTLLESEGIKPEESSNLDHFAKLDLYHQHAHKEKPKKSFGKKFYNESTPLKSTRKYKHTFSSLFKNEKKENELLIEEQNAVKQTLLQYFAGHEVKLSEELRSIIDYMSERCQLNDLNLTKKNARLYLTHLKIVDLALAEFNQGRKIKKSFPKSSFELRTLILKLCSPLMTTSEAYTKTLDPRKFKNRLYLSENNHWIPERAAQHAVIATHQLLCMQNLSKKFNFPERSLFAYRGNTASGKSTLVQKDLTPLGIKKIRGVFTPDVFKLFLRKIKLTGEKSILVNNQVHDEGVALFKSLLNAMQHKMTCQNLVMEGRFSTIEEFKENILKIARNHFGQMCLKDNASPLLTTLYRILQRDPFTHQCPPLNEIIKGHKESILYRRKLFEIVAKDSTVKEFKFFYQDESNQRYVVAEKKQKIFTVQHPELLERSCTIPSDHEIDLLIQQPISKEQIAQAIAQGLISEEAKPLLLKWEGIPLGKSIEFHSMGLSPAKALKRIQKENQWQEKYGHFLLENFETSWLNDFPNFVAHLKSDQLLTIRGVDQNGAGLHWQTNKFSWKLNPKFNPDAQLPNCPQGGFQMRVGYFVVPLKHAETFIAKNLSSDVLKELEVREKGEVVGYRLFVHPEAYAHYSKLHAQSIRFVQPADSEFMGTPTSSYRSWVLRRSSLKGKSTPFIAKMGVSSSSTDTTKLLPKFEIQASLNAQNYLDQIPNEKFKQGSQGADLLFFQENFGLALKNIRNYPPRYATGNGDPIDSGMIIREIPRELLSDCKFLSLSALMSVERSKPQHYGLSGLTGASHQADALPLIYEIIQTAIDKRLVNTSEEFLRKYFINGYLDAIEELYMKRGIPFAPHGQNLCFVLNADNTPKGWAYRDFEGMQLSSEQGYLETYSWFYRYHVFVKLLNVLVITGERMQEPFGAPTQLGAEKGALERNLETYLLKNVSGQPPKIHCESFGLILRLHISPQTYQQLLVEMDLTFLKKLNKYFNLKASDFLMPNGSIPAAEGGSSGEALTRKSNANLWQHRRDKSVKK